MALDTFAKKDSAIWTIILLCVDFELRKNTTFWLSLMGCLNKPFPRRGIGISKYDMT